MKSLLALVVLTFISFTTLAADVAQVKVKGMVCSFCSNGVKKKFSEFKEVKAVDVNMDENLVKITFNEQQNLDDKKITEVITGAGFNVSEIKR